MGQKVNPFAFRLGPVYGWTARWFAKDARYKELLLEDIILRATLEKRLKHAGLARVEIERSINRIDITLYVTRPGVVIGRGGSGLEELKNQVTQLLTKKNKNHPLKIELKVEPVKEPNLEAKIVASTVADQLARRMSHKRVVMQTIERVMNSGAKGVRVMLSGRIAGAEISRREKYQKGTIPLSTIRELIDYAAVPSLTKSGFIGVKVWICRRGGKT